MSYYYCDYCKDYKKKYHDCYKNSKGYDKYDGYYEKCDKKHEEKPWVNVKVNCCSDDKKDKVVRVSAFRAASVAAQNAPANTEIKVLFQNEQFDLANEYNPVTSTFIPAKKGVYSINTTVTFDPVDNNVNYRALVRIFVNGVPTDAADNDFFGASAFSNLVNVSTILQLQAGDRVEVFAQGNVNGMINANNIAIANATHFEAARFPSPTE
ncbi:C1q-like domain-containing protein [Bacillus cereus group sp. MYBK87-2]|uniref:C1q-like domain-containing protein n=1 Tax=unclassified Bacillus cereus group TaxID=2750818 RepID=UPI003F7AD6AA